jgi:hypothetical protein
MPARALIIRVGETVWGTLFLRDINVGRCPEGCDTSQSETVTCGLESWRTLIAGWLWWDRGSNSTRQLRPLVREGSSHQQTPCCLTVIHIWSWGPRSVLEIKTGRLTVGRNTTSADTKNSCCSHYSKQTKLHAWRQRTQTTQIRGVLMSTGVSNKQWDGLSASISVSFVNSHSANHIWSTALHTVDIDSVIT